MKRKIKIILTAVIILSLLVLGYVLYYLFFATIIEDNNQLVGGCAGVYKDYWNECCDNWARENNIFHAQCVGNWTVENNTCKWVCS